MQTLVRVVAAFVIALLLPIALLVALGVQVIKMLAASEAAADSPKKTDSLQH